MRTAANVLLPLALLTACFSEPVMEATGMPPRRSRSGPMFTRLDPATTGLQFTNELKPEHNYPYLNNGAGVAIGDVDGNGLPDVYLVSRDGPNKLFVQTSTWVFEDATARAGVDGGDAWGAGVTMVDIEGDDDLDIYVCNTESPNLLYVNRGDGTFEEQAAAFGLAHTGATQMAAFADFDRDGDLDVYLLTNRVFSGNLPIEIVRDVDPPATTVASAGEIAADAMIEELDGRAYFAGESDLLLRNDEGVFRDVTAASGIQDRGMGLGVAWWDYDDDGWPDLYVANDLESPDRLYRNQGDGSFADVTAQSLPHTAYFGMGVDTGDLDNDGRLDLMVADMSSTTHFKSKWTMGDMFDNRLWFLERSSPPQYMRNAVFLNSGTSRFQEVGNLCGLAKSDWTWAVKFGDLDNDGRLDVFATNGIPRFDTNPDIKLGLQGAPHEQAVAVARRIPPMPEENLVFRNVGDLAFQVAKDWGLGHAGVSQGAAFSDLDRDGDLDLVVNNLGEPAWVYRNDEDSAHRVTIRLRDRGGNSYGVGARVTVTTASGSQTRELSLTRGYLSSDEPILHFGLGSDSLIRQLLVRWPDGSYQWHNGLEADAHYTIHHTESDPVALASELGARWFEDQAAALGLTHHHRERDFDDFVAQPLLPHRLSRLGPGVAWGDFDGDGDDDVWVGGAAGQPGTLLRRDDAGRFEAVAGGPWERDAMCEDMGAVWIDCEGDGDLDLLVTSGGNEWPRDDKRYRDRLYLNERGLFRGAPERIPATATSSSCVSAADFDRDGDLDLFVGGRVVPERWPEAPASQLWRNDGGTFRAMTDDVLGLAELGMVTSSVWTDLDDDGWIDLVVAAHWQPVRVLRNAEGQLAAPRPLTDDSGWWNGLAAADLDGDGDMDVVATNQGDNTKYHADRDHPARLFSADFDGDGRPEVVEAKYEADRLLPVRGRSCSSNAMPFVAEQFPTYQAFAGAGLTDIYTEAALDQALRLEANQLRSGVFWNRGESFSFAPLPHRAQAAPGFGVTCGDFDQDGHVDIFLAQNFFSPEPETGRMDGGLGALLRNEGGETFSMVDATDVGVVLAGDSKGLARCDLDEDGRPDLTATVNNSALRAVRNVSTGACLAVRLRQTNGNPHAVGARIVITTTDERRVVREIHGGDSYLSQSAPIAFFGVRPAAVQEILVRWPDGTTSRQVGPAEGPEVTLSR